MDVPKPETGVPSRPQRRSSNPAILPPRSISPSAPAIDKISEKKGSPEQGRKKVKATPALPFSDDPDINFELDQRKNSWVVVTTSLEKFIICLYHPRITEASLQETFLLTFRSLIPPADLLSELIQRASGSEFEATKDVYFAQKRILKFFDKWISVHPYDFTSGNLGKILRSYIVEKVPASEPMLFRYGERILRHLEAVPQPGRLVRDSRVRSDPVTLATALTPLAFAVTHVTPREIAEQLTYLESQMFSAIEAREWLEMKWQRSRSPHITAFVEQFNKVSAWVASQILSEPEAEKRVRVIQHFISTAKLCRRLQNFNGVLEIIAGLDCISVSRLKGTWAALPTKDREIFEELQVVLGIQSNYKSYRSIIKLCKGPTIPHIGITLKDLVAAAETPDTIEDLINVDRLRMIARIIARVRQFSKEPYSHLHPDRDLQDYLEFQLTSIHNEDELYEMSLQIESYGEDDKKDKRLKKFKKSKPPRLPSRDYARLLGVETRERRSVSDTQAALKRSSWEAPTLIQHSPSSSNSESSSGTSASSHGHAELNRSDENLGEVDVTKLWI